MMNASRIALALGALALTACTQASEAEIAAAGAALPSLPPLPQPKPKFPQPQINICQSAPDLAVQTPAADNRGYKDWLYVCAPIKNVGGRAWSSNANQIGVSLSSTIPSSTTANASGFASLAAGATTNRCSWIRTPGLLGVGHRTPSWGECKATKTVTARLSFDPDIRQDGNTANDDCRSNNNSASLTLNYMSTCPW
jgi:hypothetical protein